MRRWQRFLFCLASIFGLLTLITLIFSNFTKNKTLRAGCSGICTACNGCTNLKSPGANYYLAKEDKLLKELTKRQKYFKEVLKKSAYSDAEINEIFSDTKEEFKKIIPEIPYIGGESNPQTEDLELSAMVLAFYKVQKKRGQTAEEIGNTIYKATEAGLKSYPKWLLRWSGGKFFSPKYIASVKLNAEISQKRQYEGDWVFQFLPGDGVNFDYGTDNTECGNVKFFHKQGADELTPFLCRLDFLYSDYLDEGLKRTSTLASGGSKCDFRFKRGRKPGAR